MAESLQINYLQRHLLSAPEACTLRLSYHTGIHTVDTDVIRVTFLILIKSTIRCFTLNFQGCLGFTHCIPAAVTSLLLKAGTAGLVGHGCLTSLHKDRILGTLFICIIHTVYNVTVQSRHDRLCFPY